MTDASQIVVIGGGHNGLVCAAYLAKAGRTVTLLEAADTIGGAAVTVGPQSERQKDALPGPVSQGADVAHAQIDSV